MARGSSGRTSRSGSPPVIRTGRSPLSTTCSGAAPSSICRDCAREAFASCTATSGRRTTCWQWDRSTPSSSAPPSHPSWRASTAAGSTGSSATNLFGAYACLELCRRHEAQLVFLSTSRVYPVDRLRTLPLTEGPTRFQLDDDRAVPGATGLGISEDLSLDGHRTLYGATKLAAELLIQEYVATFGLRAVVNRCGVVAGPWQMGKVDQGVVAYWMLAHVFRRQLAYIGFGGSGKQVRDLLHVDDLLGLVDLQLSDPASWAGVVANVGGGPACSASLLELTELCSEITGNVVQVSATPEDRPGDIPWYVTDCTRMNGLTSWRPSSTLRGILTDVHEWIRENERELGPALAIDGGR